MWWLQCGVCTVVVVEKRAFTNKTTPPLKPFSFYDSSIQLTLFFPNNIFTFPNKNSTFSTPPLLPSIPPSLPPHFFFYSTPLPPYSSSTPSLFHSTPPHPLPSHLPSKPSTFHLTPSHPPPIPPSLQTPLLPGK